MILPKILFRNAFRNPLRTGLTILGITIAILAFGLLRTVISTWYMGVEASSATRLVTRNAVSLVFSLPISYQERIRQIDGVRLVSHGNWFGGIYIDEKNFFPNLAVEPRTYLDLYPEYLLSEGERAAFLADRKGFIVGRKLAARYGWKIGDIVTLKGTIFPGQWDFVLRGIYRGRDKNIDETQFFFHWDYLNETMKKTMPRRADQVGFYMIGVTRPDLAAEVASAIDQIFKNSRAETLTETEKAFAQGFISMSGAIVMAVQIVSFVVIVIIMAVVANTMAMTTRERIGEYAVLKTLGFGGGHLIGLILGESVVITLIGWSGRDRPYLSRGPGLQSGVAELLSHVQREEGDLAARSGRCPSGGDGGVRRSRPAGHPDSHRRWIAEDRLMSISLSYNLRNLKARRLTTALTVAGMALVVFVLASILMMAEGLRKTLVETGSYENAMVLRKGSSSEVMSWIYRDQASVVETSPEIATEAGGKRLVAKEVVVLITLPKRESKRSSNVVLRGIGESSLLLRPQVRLVAGHPPRIGSLEVMAGSAVAKRFEGIGVGRSLSFGMNDWKIVGIFEAGNTGFDSEIWGDADSFMAAFRRPVFSSMILKLRDPSEFPRLKLRLEGDPRLTLMAKRETIYYAEQSEMMAKFLRSWGSPSRPSSP